ncbi:MAG: SDR family NAD(P)-dependent oxidoreductase [Caldilineaceae bacterium]
MNTSLLNQKNVLVTGAGRGFGAGIALGMARAGAKVCVTDIDADELQQTVLEIEAAVARCCRCG